MINERPLPKYDKHFFKLAETGLMKFKMIRGKGIRAALDLKKRNAKR